MKTERELRQERAKLIEDAGAILDTARKESRELSADEEKRFNDLHARAAQVGADIAKVQAQNEENVRKATAQLGETGNEVDERTAVLSKEQRYVDWARAHSRYEEEEYPGLSFGGFVRSMVRGARTEVERRALAEGTDSAGGYTVPDVLLARLIDRLRARATVLRAGAQTVPLTSDVTKIARLASDPTASWRLENAALSASDATFESVQFTARAVASLVIASRELIEDSVNLDTALEIVFANAIALEVDRVALRGSGTPPEPRGIRTATGVSEVSMGTNGAALTNYDKLLDLLQALQEANASDPTAAIMSPRTGTTVAKLKDTTNQPLRRPQALEPITFMTTTQVVNDEAQGTAANASTIFSGDFREVMIGVRSEMRVEVLRERYADNLQYGFVAWGRFDIQLARPAAMGRLIGVTP